MTEILMRDLNDRRYASYDGFMTGVSGQRIPCRLRPGVHRLPIEKADQLCSQFPFLFTADADEIEAFQNTKPEESLPNPPEPESSESSTSAAPASLTECSVSEEIISESES